MSEVTSCDGCGEPIARRHLRYLELEVETSVRAFEDPEGPLHFHDEDCLRRWLGVPFHLNACAPGRPLRWSDRGDEMCICLSPEVPQ